MAGGKAITGQCPDRRLSTDAPGLDMTSGNQPDFQLLSAKLHRPRVPRDLVARPRLYALLDEGLERPLTVVVAPAGFGKSTLVSSWAEELAGGARPGASPIPVAWVSLDESDSDLDVFLRYFIGALRSIFPDAAPKTLELLSARLPPIQTLSNILSNELEALPSSFALVLDDLQALTDRSVIEFLAIWTRHWPAPLHLILVSRLIPSLPLTNLRAKGKVVEVRTRDLRFTSAESAEYLGRAPGSELSDVALGTIYQHLEGWIAGLKLAMLSPDTEAQLDALPKEVLRGDVHISNYLMEEVLLRQAPEIQRFLLTISITPRFCESLCKALLDDQDPGCDVRACLDFLEDNELFLIGLDNRREWYRFHEMFRDLLQRRLLLQSGEERVNELHGRAAGWYAEHNLLDQALYHAMEAKNLVLAGQIVERGLIDLLNHTDRPRMERWLKLFPNDFVEQQPHLLLMRAFNHGLRWELGQIRRAIAQLDKLLENRTPQSDTDHAILRGQLATLKGHDAFNQGRIPEAVANCREALALMPEEWVYLRGVAGMYLGLSLHAGGQPVEAERFLATHYEAARNKSDVYALRLLQALALNALQTGLFATANRSARVMLRQSEQEGLALIQGWAHYILGYAHFQWNELEAAREHFELTTDLRYTTQLLVARNALIGLSQVHQALGNDPEAFATLDVLSRFDVEMYGQEAAATAAARARLLLWQGDLEGADQWSEAISLPPSEQLLMPWMDEPLLTRIAVLIARKRPGDLDSALEALEVMQAIAQRTHSTRSLVEILALRGLALVERGEPVEARQTLIRSVELSRRSGQIRLYVDLGLPMQRLLGQISGHRTVTTAVETILAAFSPGSGHAIVAPGPQLEERLTPREREVIALMNEPISLAEIADRLVISRATAHRHTINVYQKLGVHGRWEAVARAIELGILPASH